MEGNGDRPDIPPGQAPVRDDLKAVSSAGQVLEMQDSTPAMEGGSSQRQARSKPLIEKSTMVGKDGTSGVNEPCASRAWIASHSSGKASRDARRRGTGGRGGSGGCRGGGALGGDEGGNEEDGEDEGGQHGAMMDVRSG